VITAPAEPPRRLFGSDMARVLDDDATIRVASRTRQRPVFSKRSSTSLSQSIDMGIVTTDVPEFYKLQYKLPDITSKLRYIAKLYHNELSVIAHTSIKSIFDLDERNRRADRRRILRRQSDLFAPQHQACVVRYLTDDARSIQRSPMARLTHISPVPARSFRRAQPDQDEDRIAASGAEFL